MKEAEELKAKLQEVPVIDLGNEELDKMELTEEELPDRRFTEMGKKMEEEEKMMSMEESTNES